MENLPGNKTPLPVSGVVENKETSLDFKKIFDERLKKIKPVSDQDAKKLADLYKNPEITAIVKEIPAVLFDKNDLSTIITIPTDIWIEDPKDLDMESDYIHDQVKSGLSKQISKPINGLSLIQGNILEDDKGIRYLVLDPVRSIKIQYRMQIGEKLNEEGLVLLDVLNKYKISRVLEKYEYMENTDPHFSMKTGSKEVIGKNLLEERRANIALVNLAKKYNMTNSQYLRLKILADRLFEARAQVNLDEIAESIVKDPGNESIPVKHLPLEEK